MEANSENSQRLNVMYNTASIPQDYDLHSIKSDLSKAISFKSSHSNNNSS
ncbi:1038_t:CDS:1, partial [Funneliformis caledonium]